MYHILVLIFIFAASTEAAKVTPAILECASQAEGRVLNEPVAGLKSAVERLTASVKAGDFKGAQTVLREGPDGVKNEAINKYMVDKCSLLKSCLVCPLEMA